MKALFIFFLGMILSFNCFSQKSDSTGFEGAINFPRNLKESILNSGNEVAIEYYLSYQRKTAIGVPLVLTGSTLSIIGIVKIVEKFSCDNAHHIANTMTLGLLGPIDPLDCPPTYGGVYFGIGVILASTGGALIRSGKSDRENSRFVLNYNLKAGVTQDGLGLILNF